MKPQTKYKIITHLELLFLFLLSCLVSIGIMTLILISISMIGYQPFEHTMAIIAWLIILWLLTVKITRRFEYRTKQLYKQFYDDH